MTPAGSAANSAPATASAPSDGTRVRGRLAMRMRATRGSDYLAGAALGRLLIRLEFGDAGLEHQTRGVAFDDELVAVDAPALGRTQRSQEGVFGGHRRLGAHLLGRHDVGEVESDRRAGSRLRSNCCSRRFPSLACHPSDLPTPSSTGLCSAHRSPRSKSPCRICPPGTCALRRGRQRQAGKQQKRRASMRVIASPP